MQNSRFQTEHVANQLPFIPLVITHLPRPVDEFYAGHPFLDGDLIFPRKVVKMLNQGRHNLAYARTGLWANGFDDILREVGIKGSGIVGA